MVTSFKEGTWCLGDWCAPEPWTLPTPFVNTYFRIKTTLEVIEIARIIGREEDIPALAAHAAREAHPLYPVPKLMTARELEDVYREVITTP